MSLINIASVCDCAVDARLNVSSKPRKKLEMTVLCKA